MPNQEGSKLFAWIKSEGIERENCSEERKSIEEKGKKLDFFHGHFLNLVVWSKYLEKCGNF